MLHGNSEKKGENMTKGWECPKCGRCYPIWVGKCSHCKPKAKTIEVKWEMPGFCHVH